jgi:hypothetical protein
METKIMWAADLDWNNKILVGEVTVTWTKAQYRIIKDQPFPDLAWAYKYAKVVNKRNNRVLFYTKEEALQALFSKCCETARRLAAEAKQARHLLSVVAGALTQETTDAVEES